MIEIGDLVHLYKPDVYYPYGNGDILYQVMDQSDERSLHRNNTASFQSVELNGVQAQLHDGEISCMLNDLGTRNDTNRSGCRQYQSIETPHWYMLGRNLVSVIHLIIAPHILEVWRYINVFIKERGRTNVVYVIQIETSTKMYTPFFNRIKLTIWTICAFRVLNPHQWSLAKHVV